VVTDDGTVLPDFIIIGAMKSGTTTLDRFLRDHPEISMARDKETDYFIAEKSYCHGPHWYTGQFDPAFRLHGEASPNYTKADVFCGVPERIAAHRSDVKLVYIVRDPVERALAQYRHSWISGDLQDPLATCVDGHEWRHVLASSRYAEQLEPYLARFPREQILVLDFDDLARTPQAVMDALTAFLGTSRHLVTPGRHNDSAEIGRVPAPLLRFARSRAGRMANCVVSRGQRDAIRRLLARGKARTPPAVPEWVRDRMARELAPDASRFRAMTGLAFPGWSV
jgi:hypothetical protein